MESDEEYERVAKQYHEAFVASAPSFQDIAMKVYNEQHSK
jgi:hypothetical protein